MYEVFLHPDAQKVYINVDKALAKKIARCLQQLEQTPHFHPNSPERRFEKFLTPCTRPLNPPFWGT
uniref:type II toxin-antitoxin system RelE family toxin n=1 Tax=Petrachloros mirabilis TaxID=2918835 RepID=UPI001EE902D8|nr:hypothetical protein [Petrachloros mirabilis]